MHYARFRARGSYDTYFDEIRIDLDDLNNILSYTQPQDDCLIWQRDTTEKGYARYRQRKNGRSKQIRVHRRVFELANGITLQDEIVLHICDRPSCINPEHLKKGTIADNQHDMALKGRSCRGEKQNHSKLTEALVEEIRQLSVEGLTTREIMDNLELEVAWSTVRNVVTGKSWSHI